MTAAGRIALLLLACAIPSILYIRLHGPHAYTVPQQRRGDPPPVSLVLTMHENPMDEGWARILGDILPAERNAHWTWTNARPHLQFRIEESERWIFQVHFATVGQVLKAIGPQTIEIAVNGVTAKAVTASEAREYEVEIPVDLRPGAMNDVELRIAPVYTASDGVPLGVLLHSVGFVESR